jgi:hypothetical protein
MKESILPYLDIFKLIRKVAKREGTTYMRVGWLKFGLQRGRRGYESDHGHLLLCERNCFFIIRAERE